MYENGFLDPAYITPEEQQILDGMYEQLGISREVLDYAAEESLHQQTGFCSRE